MGNLNTLAPLAAGETRILTLTFNILPAAKCGGTSPVTLSGSPSAIQIADASGGPLTPPTTIAGGVTVTPNPITFLTASTLLPGRIGDPYSLSLSASGGSGTITGYAVTGGALPAGLALSSSGLLSGTPATIGNFSVTVTATDSNGCTGSRSFTLTVSCPTITLPQPTIPTAIKTIPYSHQFTASPAGGAYQYAVTSGALPPGLTLNLSNGLLTGTPTTVGSYSFTVTATGWANGGTGGCSGVFPATLDVIESTVPPITANPATQTLPAPNLGPGGVVTLRQTLTNNIAFNFTTIFSATLPEGLSALPGGCSAPYGTCTVGAAATIVPGESSGQLDRQVSALDLTTPQPALQAVAQAGTQVVTWAGTIPANSSLTITYLVQVGTQALSGTTYCVTTTIGGTSGPSACLTVTVTPSGPGVPPLAAGPASSQKPASVLLYNLYTSSIHSAQSDSRVAITNTNPVNPVSVHLFFVDGASCSVASQLIQLTPGQTSSFLMSQIDPGVTGYLVAVAINRDGCPIIFNDLIGESFVKFETGHQANLPAIGVSGLSPVLPLCTSGTVAATLAFDGVQYNVLPRTLAVDSLPSLANGNSPMLIVNRIGGDLSSGALPLGPLAGLLFNDIETSQSFSLNEDSCQLRGLLGNNFPRTVPRYTSVIPAGRVGWMKFWSSEDRAITGVLINQSIADYRSGHNLHALTTTNTATLTIPVFPAR
jgi:hypothetical protein